MKYMTIRRPNFLFPVMTTEDRFFRINIFLFIPEKKKKHTVIFPISDLCIGRQWEKN